MKNLKKRILSLITAAAVAFGSLGAVPEGVLPSLTFSASANYTYQGGTVDNPTPLVSSDSTGTTRLTSGYYILNDDVVFNGEINIYNNEASLTTVIINLNGHTLQATYIDLVWGPTVTINGGSGNAKGKLKLTSGYNGFHAISFAWPTSLTIENTIIEAESCSGNSINGNNSDDNVTLTNVEFTENSKGMRFEGSTVLDNCNSVPATKQIRGTVTISNGTVLSGNLFCESVNTANITGSVINGGISNCESSITITDSEINNCTVSNYQYANAAKSTTSISNSEITGATISNSTIDSDTVIKSTTVTNSTVGGEQVTNDTYDENGGTDYKVTFYKNNGTTDVYTTQTVENDNNTKATAPTDPTRTGYTFKGWYTTSACTGTAFDFANTAITANTTLYAKWLQHITYIDAAGASAIVTDYTPVTSSTTSWSGTMVASGTVKINSTVYLTDNVNLILCDGASLTVNGTDRNSAICLNTLNIYGQSGGSGTLAVVSGSGYYDCGIDVTNLTINGGTVISSGYIAIKSINDVIINGGTVTATGSSQGIRADNLTIKSGNTTAAGKTGVFIDNDEYNVNGSATFDWTKPTDSITIQNIDFCDDEKGSVTFTKPFILSGTNTLATADNIASKTLYPAYKVTFDVNYDGGEDIIKGVPASTGKVTEPADPTREGYTFGGWYTTSDCETEFDFATTTITAETTDTTIYAKWAEITFTKVPAKAATCTATGNKEYYKGSDNKYYTFADDVYTETTLAAVTIDKLGHNYENGKCTRCGEADPDYKEPDNGGNNNNNNTNTNTNTGEPKIEGGSGASGWSNIASEISKTLEGGSVTVDMAGTTTVPKSVLEAVKGKDVDLVLDMGGGITWTINGKDITSVSDSIDLGVKLGTSDIPVDVVNNVTGEHYSTTIHLNHSGKFGFKAVMTVPLRKQDAGLYANLYYYDPKAKELEFVSSAKIDKNGNAELDFNHASDYAIVIDDHPLGCRDVTAKTNGNKVKLTWDAIPDAEKYVVYYKKNGKYKKLTTVSNTALTVTGLKNGKEYEFLIRYSVDGKLFEIAESYKISVTAYYKPAPKLTAGKGYIRIIWDKVENATAYRVYKYVNGKLKLLTEIKDLAAIRLTNTKVGKEYTFAVKAYVNGEWTKVYTSDLVSAVAK